MPALATSSPTPAQKGGTKSPVEVEIERLRIPYDLAAQFPLDRLSKEKRLQVRGSHSGSEWAPADAISRFKAQMGHVTFPPLVITSDNWVVDGSTRIGACESGRRAEFPAYVLKLRFESGSASQKEELFALAGTLNQMNGTPLTKEERRATVVHLLRLGWLHEQVERAVGVPRQTVWSIAQEEEARKKLQSIGIPTNNGALKGVSIRAFGRPPAMNLNHSSLKLLVQLAKDAGLTEAEIKSFAKRIIDVGSDSAALNLLSEFREELDERIKNKALTGKGVPPASGQLRQRLGFINQFAGTEQALVEASPALRYQHLEAIRTSLGVLQTVLELSEDA